MVSFLAKKKFEKTLYSYAIHGIKWEDGANVILSDMGRWFIGWFQDIKTRFPQIDYDEFIKELFKHPHIPTLYLMYLGTAKPNEHENKIKKLVQNYLDHTEPINRLFQSGLDRNPSVVSDTMMKIVDSEEKKRYYYIDDKRNIVYYKEEVGETANVFTLTYNHESPYYTAEHTSTDVFKLEPLKLSNIPNKILNCFSTSLNYYRLKF